MTGLAMALKDLIDSAERQVAKAGGAPSGGVTPAPGLLILWSAEPTPLAASVYEPVVCLILRGAKEIIFAETVVRVGQGDALVVSHAVPVVSRIVSARPAETYLAVILSLDITLLRDLCEAVGDARDGGEDRGSNALASTKASPRLMDAIGRYLALADDTLDAKILAPAVRREIHYRLLMAPCGGQLRNLLRQRSQASMVARAISRIRASYRESIAVPELASAVGVSPSSLHKHFRAITATTPLQFQKELRLLEARRMLIAGRHTVSEVAYDVGYESPNQFSREYSRKYGVPPSVELSPPSTGQAASRG